MKESYDAIIIGAGVIGAAITLIRDSPFALTKLDPSLLLLYTTIQQEKVSNH